MHITNLSITPSGEVDIYLLALVGAGFHMGGGGGGGILSPPI